MQTFQKRLIKTKENLIEFTNGRSPDLAIILGSGFSCLTEELENPEFIDYKDIHGFPGLTVDGHKGRLYSGFFGDLNVIVFSGRYHTYEGYSAFETTYPVIAARSLGIGKIVTTNAAGSLSKKFSPGDLMLVKDHINFQSGNPLQSVHKLKIDEFLLGRTKSIFQDMTFAYDKGLRDLMLKGKFNKPLMEGILLAVNGPSYETSAEVLMYKSLGADAVCMSTVAEVIMARFLEMKVMAFSLITNFATGITDEALSHKDVLNVAGTKEKDIKLLFRFIFENLT